MGASEPDFLIRGGKGRFQGVVMQETYARSTPAENAFSRAEERTTTRTVESSAIRSKAAPYSRQNLCKLFRIVHVKGQSVSIDRPRPSRTVH